MKWFNYILLFSFSNSKFYIYFLFMLNSKQLTSLKFNFMSFRSSWKNICFSQKNWNDWKAIKLFLFENDVCFRDKTLINCKQIIIYCEFMSNETIKVYNMSCEAKSSANETISFFDLIKWQFHVFVRVFQND